MQAQLLINTAYVKKGNYDILTLKIESPRYLVVKMLPVPKGQIAYRVGAEFIAGPLLGIGLGYWVDYGFDTQPWGMVTFVVLGFMAGILNVFRTLKSMGVSKTTKNNDRKCD